MDWPTTAHLPNEPAAHTFLLAVHLTTHRQLVTIQFRHLLDVQRQRCSRLHTMHVMASAHHHMHTSRTSHPQREL